MIWYVTNVDTEILALRTAVEALPAGFGRGARRAAVDASTSAPDLDGVRVRARPPPAAAGGRGRTASTRSGPSASRGASRSSPSPARRVPDAELTALSTVPSATVTEAFAYLVNGGPENFEHLLRFVADTVLLEGFGFEPPAEIPLHGVWRAPSERDRDRPLVGVVFYRAHLVAGNTQFVDRPVRRDRGRGRRRARRVVLLAARRRRRPPVVELLARRAASTC